MITIVAKVSCGCIAELLYKNYLVMFIGTGETGRKYFKIEIKSFAK